MGAVRKIFGFFGRMIMLVVFFAIIIVAAFAATFFYINWPVEHPTVELRIDGGTSVRKISELLEEKGVIKCASCFRIYITATGNGSKLRAGDYEFESGLTASDVITKLLTGDFKTYKVTFVEGWTVDQMADYLRSLQFIENENFADEFVNLTKDKDFIDTLNISWETPTLEGYLFPSTYEVYKLREPEKLIKLMVGEFKRRFADKIKRKSDQLGLKPHQIVIMSSIVEKETGASGERPLVASVFYNRLERGMLLQSDPTTIYGIKDFDGNLTKRDLANPHKYNTYVHPGLPPGPIANAGEASIKATLNPEDTEYFYFVSKNNGSHVFSKNLSEHNKNVWEYQLNRSKDKSSKSKEQNKSGERGLKGDI